VIRAQKGGPLGWVAARYVDRKVRRAFRGVWLHGTLRPSDAPVLLYANHTSFWDGFAMHALCRAAGWDGHCMMEEASLARYAFLRRLGAFSIRRGDAASALASLRYATALLAAPARAVVVFPEGVLRPWTGALAPLERGVEVLARRSGAACVPVAIRYRFFEHELPDLLLAVGDAHAPEPLDGFAARLAAQMAHVGDARPLADFRLLVPGRRSVMERWDAVRGAAVAGAPRA